MAGAALAGPHEVESYEQSGITLSGSCIDGTQFELTCTDEANPIECDLSEAGHGTFAVTNVRVVTQRR